MARVFTDDVLASTVLATRFRDRFMELLEEYDTRGLSHSEGPAKKDNYKKKYYVCYRIGQIGRVRSSNLLPEKSAKLFAPACYRNRGKGAIPKRSPVKVKRIIVANQPRAISKYK